MPRTDRHQVWPLGGSRAGSPVVDDPIVVSDLQIADEQAAERFPAVLNDAALVTRVRAVAGGTGALTNGERDRVIAALFLYLRHLHR